MYTLFKNLRKKYETDADLVIMKDVIKLIKVGFSTPYRGKIICVKQFNGHIWFHREDTPLSVITLYDQDCKILGKALSIEELLKQHFVDML